MTASFQEPPPAGPNVIRLSRLWLTVCLIAVLLVPMTLAAGVWWIVPQSPEPELPVQVFLEPVVWPSQSSQETRFLPGVRLHNPTEEKWRNLSMTINGQYHFYAPDPLPAGGDFSVPLSFFRTSGDRAFQASTPLKKLTVYAQTASGGRAIHDQVFEK